MNYLPFVSWGVYGGSTSTETANYFASYGLRGQAPEPLIEDYETSVIGTIIKGVIHLYKNKLVV